MPGKGEPDSAATTRVDSAQCDTVTADGFHFVAREVGAPDLVVRLEDVQRLTWDRLPKQQVRSQIRFFLANGDLWTFSGSVDESALPVTPSG